MVQHLYHAICVPQGKANEHTRRTKKRWASSAIRTNQLRAKHSCTGNAGLSTLHGESNNSERQITGSAKQWACLLNVYNHTWSGSKKKWWRTFEFNIKFKGPFHHFHCYSSHPSAWTEGFLDDLCWWQEQNANGNWVRINCIGEELWCVASLARAVVLIIRTPLRAVCKRLWVYFVMVSA